MTERCYCGSDDCTDCRPRYVIDDDEPDNFDELREQMRGDDDE